MAPNVAYKNTGLSHGGHITSYSPDVLVNGLNVVRVGDTATCSIHGSVSIVNGSSSVSANGRKIARLGDSCSCGAILVSPGSTNVTSN